MNRHYALYCLVPAVLLIGISGTLMATAFVLNRSAHHEPTGRAEFVAKLQTDEHTAERLRQFAANTIEADQATQKMHGSLASLLFTLAVGPVLVAAWVTYGGYQAKKAQQGVPGATPPLRGGAA